MPDFNIPVTVTVAEVAAANFFLDDENARNAEENILRAEDGFELLPIYANPVEYLTSKVETLAASWLKRHTASIKKDLGELWDAATPAEQDAARTALGG